MILSDVKWTAFRPNPTPYLHMGLFDPVKGTYPELYSQVGQVEHGFYDPSFPFDFKNQNSFGEPNTHVKAGFVRVQAAATLPNQNANVFVGYASVELGDSDVPQAPSVTPPTNWADQGEPVVGYQAGDTGLGVYAMTAEPEQATISGAPAGWKALHGCKGIAGAACPRQWKSTDAGAPNLKYQPTVLPTGISYLKIRAEDPVGNKSPVAFAKVNVDHAKPSLALAGSLAEQSASGATASQYTLRYSAYDGDKAAASALTPVGSVGTGAGRFQRSVGTAVDALGDIYVLDHGNSRVQKFDVTGVYLSQFGSLGSGKGMLKEPLGIAVDPSGFIWVADSGNHRLMKFSGKGAFVAAIGKNVNKTKAEQAGPEGPKNICTAVSGDVCKLELPAVRMGSSTSRPRWHSRPAAARSSSTPRTTACRRSARLGNTSPRSAPPGVARLSCPPPAGWR